MESLFKSMDGEPLTDESVDFEGEDFEVEGSDEFMDDLFGDGSDADDLFDDESDGLDLSEDEIFGDDLDIEDCVEDREDDDSEEEAIDF